MIPAVMLTASIPYATLGLIAATTASLFWACSVVMHRRVGRVLPPVRLNTIKVIYASTILGMVVLVQKHYGVEPWSMPNGMLALMALSGVIGIAIGDTMFYAGLNRMGARRVLMVYTVNPVITLLVAWALLDERLNWVQLLGIAVTCGGVSWVIAERNHAKSDGHVDLPGVLFGLGAATCQSIGYLMSHYLLKHEGYDMTPVASAFLRLLACIPVLVAFLWLDRKLKDPGGQAHNHPAMPTRRQTITLFLIAVTLGTVGGIWLMQVSAKYAEKSGVASTLLSITPLFVLPITAGLGEHISRRAVVGALIAIAGVAMLYLFSV